MADGSPDEPHPFRTAWWQRLVAEKASYELTRFAILRLLALVYLVAFVSLERQLDPLLGSGGLLPVGHFLDLARRHIGAEAYWRLPTLFWFGSSDTAMHVACACGIALSAAALVGVTNAGVQLALWLLYGAFVHVGQIFYGYGWEFQLLETGMLAAFLCPFASVKPFPDRPAPKIVMWLMRWLIFRVMIGSALIKLRGDPCWRDFTCLDFHFETQPNPSPLSPLFHHAPHWVHVAQVGFTHFVELVVPFFAFGFRRVRHAAGALLVALQVALIVSGNLSFLNWLTIVPALACFDDAALAIFVPRRLRAAALARFAALKATRAQTIASGVYAVVVALLSVSVVSNLLSDHQAMNASFDPLALVNTYGAFGSVDRARYEVILEGTTDMAPGPATTWEPYELPCMPGDPRLRPCVVTPYHYRLDWQMWFVGNGAARGEQIESEPWLVHWIWQLLSGEPLASRLLARDPFPTAPPRWIRAGIWRYRFARAPSAGAWWTRERVGEFLPPVSLGHPVLREYVREEGWTDAPPPEDGIE